MSFVFYTKVVTMKQNILVYWLWAFWCAVLKHLERSVDHDFFDLYWFDVDTGKSENLLKSQIFSKNIHFLHNVKDILPTIDYLFFIFPSHFLFDVLADISHSLKKWVIVVNCNKALTDDGFAYSQKAIPLLWDITDCYWVLSGGTIADDLFDGQELGVTLAFKDLLVAQKTSKLLKNDALFVEISDDLVGVEYAWSFKNVGSILVWYLQWKWLSYGTVTYYLTRFSFEIAKLAVLLWAKAETFSITSQCRWNDFFMSATGNTRNRFFGELLGQGKNFDETLQIMNEQKKTVEWVRTLQALQFVLDRFQSHEFPLLEKVMWLMHWKLF